MKSQPDERQTSTSGTSHHTTLSPSVQAAVERAGADAIDAAGLARIIFQLHPEYAGGKGDAITLIETPARQTARTWLDDAQALFDATKLAPASEATPGLFHGRLLVIGLYLLDRTLRVELDRSGVFPALVGELQEPLREILSERGRKLLAENDLADTVPAWHDDPLRAQDEDLLGRSAFARFLAARIADVNAASGAYAIHVYGPWGAGKTSLLNLLRKALEESSQPANGWMVVEFNAWRHQHLHPPWWTLMEAVFRAAKARLPWRDRMAEYWWRLTAGRLENVIAVVVMTWLLAVWLAVGDVGGTGATAEAAENASTILALVSTIWAAVVAFNRSLIGGSARAAQQYTELTSDPTNHIKARFETLARRLLPGRVAVLIDDLDRCQSRFVVDLLEGIQTLFRDAPVVFVIAADRHWLNACYEDVYEKLQPRIREPGKPLGTLFLEKAFRFSTPMPGLPDTVKTAYWRHLLRLAPDDTDAATEARDQALEELKGAASESDVRRLVAGRLVQRRPFREQRAFLEEAVVRLAAPSVIRRLEHTLAPYALLSEQTPRSMKLLVNSYSANRALAILSELDIELHQLALWTILCSRWPQLADFLADHPDTFETIGQPDAPGIPEDLRVLWTDPGVEHVVEGHGIGESMTPLTLETIKQCAQLRS